MAAGDQHVMSETPHGHHVGMTPEEAITDTQSRTTAQEPAETSGDGAAANAGEASQELTLEGVQAQLAQQNQKAEEYFDQLQRLQADFQNFRRRATQERSEASRRGKEDVLRALIPVLHNFQLALQHVDQDAQAVRQGVQMIWQQFEGFLRDQKVEPVPTVGQIFDPAYHEVLSTVPATADTPANTIVTEVKAGYSLDGRLLSPAQVIVAQAAEATTRATPVTSEATSN